ncbi:MAG: efflux RND transporter periplasmic adaptor subunit [Ignavibacteriaceae bacterium]|nr:efflux RND transporter periplasmic adaptor subunit [Ignavibacteriaceae bacterium]
MNANKIIIAFLTILSLTLLTGCGGEEKVEKEISVPVKVYQVQPEALSQYIKLTGMVTAAKDQMVFSKTSERIEQLLLKPGDRITEGQIIARQYSALFKQTADAAKAGADNARAQYILAEANYKRMERLYSQKAVSPQQFEQAEMQFKAAKAGLDAAEAQYLSAKEQLENCYIKAPFDGVVAAVFVELNQMLPAGQPVAQIIDPRNMNAKVRVSAKDIQSVKKGYNADIVVPAISGKTYKGKVITLDQAIDPVSKTFEAEILILNPDTDLKSGLYAEFMIISRTIEDAIIVPETSLLSQTAVTINKETGTQQNSRKFFLFVVENQRAKIKEVSVGLTSNGRAEITKGLAVNEQIIVVGNNIVQDGQLVSIVE